MSDPFGKKLPKIYMESTEVGTTASTKSWGTVPKTPSCSFKDVMSEELALELEKTDIRNVTYVSILQNKCASSIVILRINS